MKSESVATMSIQPICWHCRYDLTGFAVGDRCPECGSTIHTLARPLRIPGSATVGVVLGTLGLVCVGCTCVGAWPMIFGFPLASWAGAIASIVARQELRRRPHLYAQQAMARARLGFWLSMPGVVGTCVLGAAAIYAMIIGV